MTCEYDVSILFQSMNRKLFKLKCSINFCKIICLYKCELTNWGRVYKQKHETKSCEQNERVDDVPGVYENEAWKCKWQKSKKTWERQRETARLVDCERASEWECSLSCYAGLRLTLCASVLVCIGFWLAVACVCVCVRRCYRISCASNVIVTVGPKP